VLNTSGWQALNLSQHAVKFSAITVTCYGRAKQSIHVSSAKTEGKNHLGETAVDGRIILKCILNKQGRG